VTSYRLRPISGIALTGGTYGSGTYGSGTYGQTATDPAGNNFRPIPWPDGSARIPSWEYVEGDARGPFQCQIQEGGLPLDLSTVARAFLTLVPNDGRGALTARRYYRLLVEIAAQGRLIRNWRRGDLVGAVGTYRPAIILQFLSGRLLTLPFGDQYTFYVGGMVDVDIAMHMP
jgi:hypothetical protein